MNSILIIGNGKTTSKINWKWLKNSKIDTFGMNSAYRMYEKEQFYPTYYANLDDVVIISHKKNLQELLDKKKIKKYFYLRNCSFKKYEYKDYQFNENERYVGVHKKNTKEKKLSTNFNNFYSWGNTGSDCVQIAIMLGYTDIYVIGIDGYVEKIKNSNEINDLKSSISINNLYNELLYRDVDDKGLNSYLKILKKGNNINDIKNSIIESEEYKIFIKKKKYIDDLYKRYSFRNPKYNEIKYLIPKTNINKIINFVILNNLYNILFLRDIDNEGKKYYSNLLEKGITIRNIRNLLLKSKEFDNAIKKKKIFLDEYLNKHNKKPTFKQIYNHYNPEKINKKKFKISKRNTLIINETPKNNPNYFFAEYQKKGDEYNYPNSSTAHVPGWIFTNNICKKKNIKLRNMSNPNYIKCIEKISYDNFKKKFN